MSALTSHREPALDGLRAFAILSVVVMHAAMDLFPGGWLGVEMFFTLSGYLITRLLLNELAVTGRVDLGAFYWRRFLRLGPALFLLLALLGVLRLAAPQLGPRPVELAVAGGYLMNWALAFDVLHSTSLAHTWSLAVEEQFYLAWPAVLLILYRHDHGRAVRWLLGSVAVLFCWRLLLVLGGADPTRTYCGFDTHADSILIGCALAFLRRPAIARLAARTAALPVAFLVTGMFLWDGDHFFDRTFLLPLAGAASAWIIVAATQPGTFQRVLALPALAYTGRISYGWYLWHIPVLDIGSRLLPPGRPVAFALVFASYPIAMASYRFIERPVLRWNRASRRVEAAAQVTTHHGSRS